MTRNCEICDTEYKSGASYRVHKSRYHRPNNVNDDVTKTEEPLVEIKQEAENAPESTPTPNPSPRKPTEVKPRGSGNNDWLVVGGAVVAVVLAIFFGGRR
jgi:hypothetical protein